MYKSPRIRALEALEYALPSARSLVARLNRIYYDPINQRHSEKQREKWAVQAEEGKKVDLVLVDIVPAADLRKRVN